jgi:hypothetical protein
VCHRVCSCRRIECLPALQIPNVQTSSEDVLQRWKMHAQHVFKSQIEANRE